MINDKFQMADRFTYGSAFDNYGGNVFGNVLRNGINRSYYYSNIYNPYDNNNNIYRSGLYYNSFFPDNLNNYGYEPTWSDYIYAARNAPYYYYPYSNRRVDYYVPGTNLVATWPTASTATASETPPPLPVNPVQISTDANISVADWLAKPNTFVHRATDPNVRPVLLFCKTGRPRAVDPSASTRENPVLMIDNVAYQCSK